MSYGVERNPRAAAELSRLDRNIAGQVEGKIAEMAASAEVWQHIALTGQYRGQYRLRVGSYRVVYELDHDNRRIVVVRIQHRSESYRRQG